MLVLRLFRRRALRQSASQLCDKHQNELTKTATSLALPHAGTLLQYHPTCSASIFISVDRHFVSVSELCLRTDTKLVPWPRRNGRVSVYSLVSELQFEQVCTMGPHLPLKNTSNVALMSVIFVTVLANQEFASISRNREFGQTK